MSKSAASVRIAPVRRTSGSHVRQYAPLPASTEPAQCKRFRSICLKQDVDDTQKDKDKNLKTYKS
ncbi:hypothetical protein [Listeria cornellensis]|uniref:Uncharacterized protein n=1 Tax=Listeria cornellensis FSL F6-0969 TaxID=1265820 RepID=W7BQK2_9LIST|nr:hypothetical protein [Listeria cornellensis]EUJ25426.1 hypothetical protein PCORN_17284 [Listeria cornellensis FSL F6-0969]